MKKFLGFLFCVAASFFAPLSYAYCSAYIMTSSNSELEALGASDGVSVSKKNFFDGEGNRFGVRIEYSPKGDGWERVSYKIKPKRDCVVKIALAAPWHFKDKTLQHFAVLYDDVCVDGKPLPNGGFEKGLLGWKASGLPFPTKIMSGGSEGKRCLRTWARCYVSQEVSAKAGVPLEISFSTKKVGFVSSADPDIFLDLSPFVNAGDADLKKLGARKNNFSTLKAGSAKFGGIGFDIAGGEKRGVAMFGKKYPQGAKKIVFKNLGSAKYLYVLHTSFFNGGSPVNGKITMKCADGIDVETVLRRADATWLFEDSRERTGNILRVWSADKQNKLGNLYLSKFPIPNGAPLDLLEISSSGSDTMLVLGATLSDIDITTFRIIETTEKNGWTRVDMPENLEVLKGSALDQSGFFSEGRAGDNGRVIISPRGTLAFEKTPDADVRFKGFSEHFITSRAMTLPKEKRDAAIVRYAASFKRTGYNFVRGYYGAGNEINSPRSAEYTDAYDRLVAEFKKNGVYIHLVFYRVPLKGYNFYIRDDVKLRTVFGDPFVWEQWRKSVSDTLNHVNPYTGIAYKDDPAIACVEFYNELSICFSRIDKSARFDPKDTIFPETEKLVLSKWRAWLVKKYGGDISKLNAAWNSFGMARRDFAYKNFDEVECIARGNFDWEKCCWDNLEKFMKFARKTVEEIGYKGLCVQNNLGSDAYGGGVRWRGSDYVIFDTYFSHPSSFRLDDARVGQSSPIDSLLGYWRAAASTKLRGRPFGMAEYNHCFWNRYRYEMPASFPSYSAFQNFSVLTMHESGVPMPDFKYGKIGFFTIANSPAARVNELYSSAFFVRGDVKKSRSEIEMEATSDFLENVDISARGYNSTQSRVLLLTGFASKFDGGVPAAVKGVKPCRAAMKMRPVGSSEIRREAWFQEVVENAADKSFDIGKFVEVMRKKGVLPKDNATDIARGIYQSDTGQITLDQKNLRLQVITPRSEIVAFAKPKPQRLGALEIVSCNVSASVGAVSLDGKKFAETSRAMLTFLTRESNLGMKFSPEYWISSGDGTFGALENGVLEVRLKLDPSKKWAVYPVAMNGARRAEIPSVFEDGALCVRIDNSKLPDGSTPFFEVSAK